jgi:hypothetical protein
MVERVQYNSTLLWRFHHWGDPPGVWQYVGQPSAAAACSAAEMMGFRVDTVERVEEMYLAMKARNDGDRGSLQVLHDPVPAQPGQPPGSLPEVPAPIGGGPPHDLGPAYRSGAVLGVGPQEGVKTKGAIRIVPSPGVDRGEIDPF